MLLWDLLALLVVFASGVIIAIEGPLWATAAVLFYMCYNYLDRAEG